MKVGSVGTERVIFFERIEEVRSVPCTQALEEGNATAITQGGGLHYRHVRRAA